VDAGSPCGSQMVATPFIRYNGMVLLGPAASELKGRSHIPFASTHPAAVQIVVTCSPWSTSMPDSRDVPTGEQVF
jgi:hypothetical protein